MKNTIYAVVWNDFIPLSLVCENESAAIKAAQGIAERARHIDYIRAVKLTESDELITLWKKEA